MRKAVSNKSLPVTAPVRVEQLDGVTSFGSLIFTEAGSVTAMQEAKFTVVHKDIDVDMLCGIFQAPDHSEHGGGGWGLPKPSVLISVTGSAQEMQLESGLELSIKQGLSSAARASDAWVFTGGMDTGVMAMAGSAMRVIGDSGNERTPCIGIVPFHKVTHKKLLQQPQQQQPQQHHSQQAHPQHHGSSSNLLKRQYSQHAQQHHHHGSDHAAGSENSGGEGGGASSSSLDKFVETTYVKRKPNSNESSALDVNHTHFFCIDNPEDRDWGGEIELRAKLEAALAARFKIPIVLIVVQGGPGTFANVRKAVETDKRVILVKESRGAAQIISEYFAPLMGDNYHNVLSMDTAALEQELTIHDDQFQVKLLQLCERYFIKKEQVPKILKDLHFFAKRLDLFTVYSTSDEARFDVAILKAIIGSFREDKVNEQITSEKRQRAVTLVPLEGIVKLHRRARLPHPSYPERVHVPDDKVTWDAPWVDYTPRPYTAPKVGENWETHKGVGAKGWADPPTPLGEDDTSPEANPEDSIAVPFDEEFQNVLKNRCSYRDAWFEHAALNKWYGDHLGRPLNPHGRTGISERGLLGKWGANQAADPIVTRFHPTSGQLQMVAIQRSDTKEWALPGGIVDAGEFVSQTVKREFKEECLNEATMKPAEIERNQRLINELFASGRVVYRGYVDDPRNTDNAWLETTAFHFHCTSECAGMLKLEAGDDATKAKWITIDHSDERYIGLYASHKDWVDKVAQGLLSHNLARQSDPKMTQRFGYPKRFPVPDDKVAWAIDWPQYEPTDVQGMEEVEEPLSVTLTTHPGHSNRQRVRRRSSGSYAMPHPHLLTSDAPSPSMTTFPGLARGKSLRKFSASTSTSTATHDESNMGGQVPWYQMSEVRSAINAKWNKDLSGEQVLLPDGQRKTLAAAVKQNVSYESPIRFEKESGLPLNPRGRTGLRGPGVLQIGPNHRIEAIITRFHPRGTVHAAAFDAAAKMISLKTAAKKKKAKDGDKVAKAQAKAATRAANKAAARAERRGRWSDESDSDGSHSGREESDDLLASLQVLAFPLRVDGEVTYHVIPPHVIHERDPDRPQEHKISLEMQTELMEEMRRRDEPGTMERIEYLLQELFSGANSRAIYCGYVDDPRNTDHAWVEATVRLHHLSRELGGQLYFADENCRCKWVSIQDRRLTASSGKLREWISVAKSMVKQEFGTPGLLQMVVRWGRNDMAQLVLNDGDFRDQRQPKHVQRAFQDALERSMEPAFDVSLVQTLLEHGAQAAGVFLPNLFSSMTHDSFGYCKALREGKYKSSRQTHLLMQRGAHKEPRRDVYARLVPVTLQRSARRFSSVVLSGTALTNVQQGGGGGGGGRGQGAAPTVNATPSVTLASPSLSNVQVRTPNQSVITPWKEPHVELIVSLGVLGFEDYARRQPVVHYLDLMVWSIVVGALEEARVLWRKTRSPLRAGIVAQAMCQQIKKDKNMREDDLDEATRKFSEDLIGVLDHLTDDEEARKLLTATHGDLATIGRKGGHRCNTLELAIGLENRDFVAHRRCQTILYEQWRGRSADCGLVQLGRHGRWRLDLNDLHPTYIKGAGGGGGGRGGGGGAGGSSEDDAPRPSDRFSPLWVYGVEVWRIPKVKRYTHMASTLGFVFSFCSVCFQPLCGPLHTTHYVFFLYFICKCVQEIHSINLDDGSHKRNRFWFILKLVFRVLLALACVLRYALSIEDGDRFAGAMASAADRPWYHLSLIEIVRDAADPTGNWTRPPLDQHQIDFGAGGGLRVPHGGLSDDCEVSIVLDLLRSILGLSALLESLQLLEFFLMDQRVGVLLVCVRSMIGEDLKAWVVPMLVISFGFSVSFSVLAPNFHQRSEFQLAESLGPLRPWAANEFTLDLSAGGPFFLPFWALYGFFEPGELAAAPASSSIAPVVLWVYLMVALVVFVNLLIAQFNESFQRVNRDASAQYKMQMVHQMTSYIRCYPLPPPLNVPALALELLWRLLILLGTLVLTPAAIWYLRRSAARDEGGGGGGGDGGGGTGGGGRVHRAALTVLERYDSLDRLWLFRGDPDLHHQHRSSREEGEHTEITPLRAEAAEKRAMNDFLDSTERRRRSRLANMQKGTFESEVLSKLSKFEEQLNSGGGGGGGGALNLANVPYGSRGGGRSSTAMSATSNDRSSSRSGDKSRPTRNTDGERVSGLTTEALATRDKAQQQQSRHAASATDKATVDGEDQGGSEDERNLPDAPEPPEVSSSLHQRLAKEVDALRSKLDEISELLNTSVTAAAAAAAPAPAPRAAAATDDVSTARASMTTAANMPTRVSFALDVRASSLDAELGDLDETPRQSPSPVKPTPPSSPAKAEPTSPPVMGASSQAESGDRDDAVCPTPTPTPRQMSAPSVDAIPFNLTATGEQPAQQQESTVPPLEIQAREAANGEITFLM